MSEENPPTWRPIRGAPGYEVSSTGQVRGQRGWLLVPQVPKDRKDGKNARVHIITNNGARKVSIAKLVAQAFGGGHEPR